MMMSKKEATVLVEKGLLKKEIYDSIPDDNVPKEKLLYEMTTKQNGKGNNIIPTHKQNNEHTETTSRINKYRNVKVYMYEDGVTSEERDLIGHGDIKYTFDSKKEFDRWNQLQMLERAGGISELSRQKTFVLLEGYKIDGRTVYPVLYRADFYYKNNVTGKYVIEDVKPFDKKTKKYKTTKDFAIKRKMLEHRYCLDGTCIFQLY